MLNEYHFTTSQFNKIVCARIETLPAFQYGIDRVAGINFVGDARYCSRLQIGDNLVK